MTQRQMRTLGLVVIAVAAWLILSPRINGPTMIGPVPIQYFGWPTLIVGWIVLIRAMKGRSGSDA